MKFILVPSTRSFFLYIYKKKRLASGFATLVYHFRGQEHSQRHFSLFWLPSCNLPTPKIELRACCAEYMPEIYPQLLGHPVVVVQDLKLSLVHWFYLNADFYIACLLFFFCNFMIFLFLCLH